MVLSLILKTMLALYRKYRPKKFADLIGQEDLRETLQNAAKTDKISHAYLFYGGRGSGKTTIARIIAKVVNCEKRRQDPLFKSEGEPCNDCRVCNEIDAGNSLDVIEIDAASNRGVDDVRALKEGIRLAPSSYPFKVLIVDEMHMLTREAFNALLKTLEEPPAHTIFILATTEYDKVPATISSRAQRFHFKKIAIADIVLKLKRIAEIEKLKITDDALELVASLGDGSLRDAESMLQQLAAFSDEINAEAVSKIIGRVGFKNVLALADLLIKRDLSGALRMTSAFYDQGHNLTDLNKELINYLRRVLSFKFDTRLEEIFVREMTKDELGSLKNHSVIFDTTAAVSLIKALIRAYSEMRYSPLSVAPLEVAIIESLNKK